MQTGGRPRRGILFTASSNASKRRQVGPSELLDRHLLWSDVPDRIVGDLGRTHETLRRRIGGNGLADLG